MTREQIGVPPPRFRLPDATHVGRVHLQVSDLTRSIAYYEEVLGLRVLESAAGNAKLAAHGDDRILLELTERPDAQPVPRRGLLGLYHFAVLLPDRGSLAKFVMHLADIGERAGMSDHLVSEAIYLYDPDGLGIEVYADKPRDTWQVVQGQLAMASNPLDVQNLVEAAGGEHWSGAPAGTVIGHVHFYVGDIEQAQAFYHAGLGLDKIVWNYPGALFLSAGGYHHHVGTNTWAAGSPVATDNDARLLHWDLVLPDENSANDAAQSIESAGFTVDRTGRDTFATDPWGIRVRLTAA